MSTSSDDPCFPTQYTDRDGDLSTHWGMTIREQFAIQCLASLLTHVEMASYSQAQAANQAIEYADALIAELNK